MWRKLKHNFRQWHLVLLTAPSVAGIVVLVSLTGIFQLLEWATLDQWFRLRPSEPPDPRLVIVGINEADIVKIGQWSMSDADLTQLLTHIKQQNPRVIGLDIYRDLPQQPGHQTLIDLFKSTPNLIGVEKTTGKTVAPPPILVELDQVGSSDLLIDPDNKVRRGFLSLRDKNGQTKFSLGVKLAFHYLQSEGIELETIDESTKTYRLGKGIFQRLTGNDGGYVGVDDVGYQILLNYRGAEGSFPVISMTDVLENRIPPNFMRDHIVLIGSMAPSVQDFFYTPYNIHESNYMSGVEVHAHLTSQLISTALDGRSLIKTIPDPLEWLGILLWSTSSGILGINVLRQRWSILGIPVLSGVLILSSYVAFLLGWWIPIVPALLAIFASGTISIVCLLWDNLKLSYQKLEDYAQTLEEKVSKRTEQLRLSEEMFVSIFRSTPNPITITARQTGKHLLVNENFCELTGYRREEVIGKTAVDLNLWVNQESRTELFKLLDNNQGKVRNYEGDFRTKSGEVRTALLSAEIIDFDGKECLLSVSNDITERKQAEKALKKAKEAADAANKTKSEFLANMSHELRTPLNAILGFTRLMTRIPSPNSEQHDYLEIIGRSGEHLLSLINDVLDLSKIEAGRITVNENIFNLVQLLETLQDMFQLKAESKGLQLIFEQNYTLPQYIKTDESKLRQVLINLLSNAIKFTEKGAIILRAKKDYQNSSHCLLNFEVEDTGKGISSQELHSIFDPFVQTETGRQSQEGTGLGLSISQKFVNLMGGKITVKSIVDQGTTFAFNIQAQSSEEEDATTQPSQRKIIGLAPNQPNYRILVVEDTWESRTLLVKLLKFVGFEVKGAKNGQEAIKLWQDWEPHLIWMDMRMPVMNGYEATKKIKSQLKGQATTIIALTASVFEAEKSAILTIGCDDFVYKPIQEEIIFSKMAEYLGVYYLYEDTIVSELSSPTKTQVDLQDIQASISQMSEDWITRLHHAAAEGNDLYIDNILEEIPSGNIILKTVLKDWNHEFKFDKILKFTQNNN